MSPIAITIISLTIAALAAMAAGMIATYRRKRRSDEPMFVTVIATGKSSAEIDTRGCA